MHRKGSFKRKSIVRSKSGGFVATNGSTREAQTAELLFKGSRDEIKLIGVYPLKKHKYLYAFAYDGQRKPNGAKNMVSQTTGETDMVKARAKAEEFAADLIRQWDQKYGANGTNPTTQDNQPVRVPDGCIEQQILERLDMKKAEVGEGQTLGAYLAAARCVLDFLGQKRAWGRWEMLSDNVIVRLKEARLRGLDPNTDSPWQVMNIMSFLLDGLPGFKQEWLDLLKVPKGTKGWRGDKKSDDFPFLIHELGLMHLNLPRASDTAKGLHWFGISGLMHSGDAALTRWQQLDDAVQAIAEGRRTKNGNPFRYGIWPELLAWLSTRKRKPGDIYIFPELVFTEGQLKNPLCNKTPLTKEGEKSATIKTRIWNAFHEFLILCGITREGVSFRSYRSFNSSELFAAGYEVPLLKAVTGHNTDESFFKYVHILPRHIARLAENHRRQYLAFAAGTPLPVYLTHTEVVEELTSVASKNQAEIKRFAAAALESLGGQLKTQLGNLIVTTMNNMAAQVVGAFCRVLGGQIHPRSDGAVIIQLPRLALLENLTPTAVLSPGLPANDQQLTLTFLNGKTQILN
jgi:hypothetical protein